MPKTYLPLPSLLLARLPTEYTAQFFLRESDHLQHMNLPYNHIGDGLFPACTPHFLHSVPSAQLKHHIYRHKKSESKQYKKGYSFETRGDKHFGPL